MKNKSVPGYGLSLTFLLKATILSVHHIKPTLALPCSVDVNSKKPEMVKIFKFTLPKLLVDVG